MAIAQQHTAAPAATPSVASTTMTAVVQDAYGEADAVLRLDQVQRPQFADDEVLIRVHAAGVDKGVWHIMAGLPYPVRLAGYGVRAPKTGVRGREVAGTVEAVGDAVTTLRPGDAVFGIAEGSFAQYACARADKLAAKPERLSFEQAASVAVSALTALQGLRDHARVQPGQQVLIIGASGGVGTFAVQIAKAYGAHVTGVCSTSKIGLVRSLGADHVIDYASEAITDAGRRYDVILDIAGNRPLSVLRQALAARGMLVIVGGETGGRWLAGSDRQLRALALSPFLGQTLKSFICSENEQDLVALAELIESGQVTPVLERTYALDEVPAAIAHMHGGRARGKVVITMPLAA